MCCFYMGIAQIALDPPLCQTGKRGKKVPQTILASPYTPRQCGKKVPQIILASLYTPPPLIMGQLWKKNISKRG